MCWSKVIVNIGIIWWRKRIIKTKCWHPRVIVIYDSFDEKGILKMTNDKKKKNYENTMLTFQGYPSWSKQTYLSKFSPVIRLRIPLKVDGLLKQTPRPDPDRVTNMHKLNRKRNRIRRGGSQIKVGTGLVETEIVRLVRQN